MTQNHVNYAKSQTSADIALATTAKTKTLLRSRLRRAASSDASNSLRGSPRPWFESRCLTAFSSDSNIEASIPQPVCAVNKKVPNRHEDAGGGV